MDLLENADRFDVDITILASRLVGAATVKVPDWQIIQRNDFILVDSLRLAPVQLQHYRVIEFKIQKYETATNFIRI